MCSSCDGVLSAAEIADLSRNIWAVWQAPARRLWVSGNETNNLTGTDSIQGNAAGIGNIAQTQALATDGTDTDESGEWGYDHGERRRRSRSGSNYLWKLRRQQQALPSVTSCR